MSVTSFEDVITILQCFDDEGLNRHSLWWRTDDEYAPVTFLLNCNDLFVWGCADCEPVTASDVPEIRLAIADLKSQGDDPENAGLLWVARKRKCRPQVAYYEYFSETEKVLFDACGPAEEQYGNMENPRYREFVKLLKKEEKE